MGVSVESGAPIRSMDSKDISLPRKGVADKNIRC